MNQKKYVIKVSKSMSKTSMKVSIFKALTMSTLGISVLTACGGGNGDATSVSEPTSNIPNKNTAPSINLLSVKINEAGDAVVV